VCLDIFLLPGASDVATQVERLSSSQRYLKFPDQPILSS
jgi:hypothetical protein